MVTKNKILLHCCCAPCSGDIIDQLLSEGFVPTVFFYNPNIYPYEEYLKRKASLKDYILRKELDWVDLDYDHTIFLTRIKGLENELERGLRCTVCFDLRLERAALYAYQHQYNYFATTNGFGRWKDINQVNESGRKASQKYQSLMYLDRNWRKGNASLKASKIAKAESFYYQTYCGCEYSQKPVVSL